MVTSCREFACGRVCGVSADGYDVGVIIRIWLWNLITNPENMVPRPVNFVAPAWLTLKRPPHPGFVGLRILLNRDSTF